VDRYGRLFQPGEMERSKTAIASNRAEGGIFSHDTTSHLYFVRVYNSYTSPGSPCFRPETDQDNVKVADAASGDGLESELVRAKPPCSISRAPESSMRSAYIYINV